MNNIDTYLNEFNHLRIELEGLFNKIASDEKILSKVNKSWNVKDLLAHITWHDQEMVELLQTRVFKGSELWNLPADERNSEIQKLYKNQKWSVILQQFNQNTKLLGYLLSILDQEDWENPSRFEFIPNEFKPFDIIDTNLNTHYYDHIDSLRRI